MFNICNFRRTFLSLMLNKYLSIFMGKAVVGILSANSVRVAAIGRGLGCYAINEELEEKEPSCLVLAHARCGGRPK